MMKLPLAALAVLFSCLRLSVAMTDKATGISFSPTTKNGLEIFGVGVRKKGPIKVYSVAMYCTSALKEKLASFSKTDKKAVALLREEAPESATFELEMAFKVGAEKMASAIAESVAPRHKNSGEVEQLKDLIFKGVSAKGAAVKGTKFQFDCTSSSVGVAVDGITQGSVSSSSGLSKAFCDVYLDDKCVSLALRNSVLETCCAP